MVLNPLNVEESGIREACALGQDLLRPDVADNLEVLRGGQLQCAVGPTEVIAAAGEDALGIATTADLDESAQ